MLPSVCRASGDAEQSCQYLFSKPVADLPLTMPAHRQSHRQQQEDASCGKLQVAPAASQSARTAEPQLHCCFHTPARMPSMISVRKHARLTMLVPPPFAPIWCACFWHAMACHTGLFLSMGGHAIRATVQNMSVGQLASTFRASLPP